MKRVFTFLLCLLSVIASQACIKRASVAVDSTIVVGLVMDSTSALIEGAEVHIGKSVLRTSWDGRFLLTPALRAQSDKITIVCENYEEKTVALKGITTEEPLKIILKRKKGSKGSNHYTTLGAGKPRGEILYKTAAVYAEAESDGAVAEVAMAYDASAAPHKHSGMMSETSNNAKAGLLTAGEVNDFAKWYFWPRVLDDTHKKYIDTWHFTPRHRFTVQITNQAGFPLVNRPVSLLDDKGNTLFQAITDNTGKAELWYQLISNNQCGKHAGLQIRAEGQTIAAREWSEGLNRIVIDEACDVPASVDVMFVFDATGSMDDELRYLQAEMRDVINRSQQAIDGVQVRTGAVVYRDKGDEYVTRISRLTNKIATTQSFIDKQEANGGGDYPEAVPEALMAAINSAGWDDDARARIAFLILDAPCHEDSATVALLHEQVLNAAAQGIRIVPVVCSGLGESGELLLRSIALATNGTSFFLTDDSGIGNKHLKPTTDSLKVEHLNDMLVRTIIEFSQMPDCTAEWAEQALAENDGQFVPNPFEAQDLDSTITALPQQDISQVLVVRPNPCKGYCLVDLPQSTEALYIVDISGKTVQQIGKNMQPTTALSVSVADLSTGVYFVKAFFGGRWYTVKLIVYN